MAAIRVFVRTFRLIWEDLLLLSLMNTLTTVCMLLVIPGAAAWAGMYHVCNRVANGYAISWDQYFDAFKHQWRQWTPFTLIATLITALVVFNFFAYPAMMGESDVVIWIQGAWLAAGAMWMAIQFYVYPLMVEQEKKSWRTALRNSAVIAGSSPLFTTLLLVLGGGLIVATVLIVAPVTVLLGVAFWQMLGSAAVKDRLALYRKRQGLPDPHEVDPSGTTR